MSISKEEIMLKPLQGYEGKVVIVANEKDLESALSEINEASVVGFDTEAKPTFKKGQIRKISLIQVATEEKVFLIRTNFTGVTDGLHAFFEGESPQKIGIGLLDDFNLLDRLRPFQPNGFIDLNNTFNELGAENIGARNLAAMVLDIRISKSAQTSNWESPELSPKQIRYASTDAWICLEIYKKLDNWGYLS